MNAVEIEEAISKLAELPFDPEGFPYAFLEAFGNKATTIKRVFNIDVETCRVCGGTAKVIACIEDPVVIKTILAHIEAQAPKPGEPVLPDSRAPPQASLFS